uniref:Uncharacterized protein n=1 Tax=Romanomermis culicivorax TaxID=13658 RepID=A0A915K4B7_ROMCU
MSFQNQYLLGRVVQDASATALDQNLEVHMNRKAAHTESTINKIRVNQLQGDMLSAKINDFPFLSCPPDKNFTEWAKKLEKQMILKDIKNEDEQCDVDRLGYT